VRQAWTTRLAWGLWVVTALLSVATLLLRALIRVSAPGDPSHNVPAIVVANVTFMAFATVGALVASRRPGNAVGWIFCVAPILCQLSNVVDEYSTVAGERGWPGVVWPSVGLAPLWVTGVELVAIFGLLLFPDGHLPSPRWRAVAVAGAIAIAVGVVAGWLTPGRTVGAPGHDNPIGVPGAGAIFGVSLLVFVVVLGAVLVSVVVRFRRSSGIEREQLRVFLGATSSVAIFLAVLAGLSGIGPVKSALGGGFDVLFLLALAVVPVSIGVAILRYRLYDIDRIISRTLVYGVLTVTLGAAYVGLVLAGQALFSSFAGGSHLAVAASTLVVAAVFLPLRSRVQRFVDRRFYRRRYDAQRTLESFGARLREQVELATLDGDLRSAVTETMQPAHVALWLRREHR
jgi:hypothetical protein